VSEFTRIVDLRGITDAPLHLVASAEECAALARRFSIPAVHSFKAQIALEKEGAEVFASGRLKAAITQSCAISGEEIAVSIDEPVMLRFVPDNRPAVPNEEIELAADELDEVSYSGTQFDLGEELAQELSLAIDPYLTGPQAEEARRRAGIIGQEASGPFAALAALKGASKGKS